MAIDAQVRDLVYVINSQTESIKSQQGHGSEWYFKVRMVVFGYDNQKFIVSDQICFNEHLSCYQLHVIYQWI